MNSNFDGYSISYELYLWLVDNLPEGKTILELGSGAGTSELVKHWTVYSIEHDLTYVGLESKSTYIHCSIINNWYDVDALKQQMPEEYDLILVDGPPGSIGRGGFLTNLSLFKTDVPIILDDVHRSAELDLLLQVSKQLNRSYTIFKNEEKSFGIIQV